MASAAPSGASGPRGEQGRVYLLRPAAFALIVIAIGQKNLARRTD